MGQIQIAEIHHIEADGRQRESVSYLGNAVLYAAYCIAVKFRRLDLFAEEQRSVNTGCEFLKTMHRAIAGKRVHYHQRYHVTGPHITLHIAKPINLLDYSLIRDQKK